MGLKSTTKKPDMLDALTSFRFVAALMVFVWHTHIMGDVLDKYQLGYVGVGFFYLLSGFILTYVYFNKIRSGNAERIKKFYIARIAKIYPMHILTLVASIPLYISTVQAAFPYETKRYFIENLGINTLLLQSYFPSNAVNFSFNGVAWSISVEMFFYAVFPLLIYIIGKYLKELTTNRMFMLIGLVWLMMFVAFAPVQSYLDDWRLYIFPLARLPEFIIGILLGLIYLRQQKDKVENVFINKHATKLELATVAGLVLAILISPVLPQSLRFAAWLVPFWAVLVFIFSLQRGAISKILMHKPFVYLGEISFSFYMIHQLVIKYIYLIGIPSIVISAALSFAVTLTVSALLYRYYEEPLRLVSKRRLESYAATVKVW